MKRLFFTFCLGLVYVLTFAQSKTELLELLKQNQEPTFQINTYLKLSQMSIEESDESLQYVDAALKISENKKLDSYSIELLCQKAEIYLKKKNTYQALTHAFEALILSENLNDYKKIALSEFYISKIFFKDEAYDKSIQYLKKAISYFEENPKSDSQTYFSALELLADAFFMKQDFLESEIHYEKLARLLPPTNGKEKSYYFLMDKWSVAAKNANHTDKAIEIAKMNYSQALQSQDKKRMSFTANSLGFLYRQKNDFLQAKQYFEIAIQSLENQSDRNLLNNLAITLTRLEKYGEARKNYLEALKITSENTAEYVDCMNLISMNSFLNSNYIQALQEVNKAIEIAIPLNIYKELSESYLILFNVLNELNEPLKAQEAYKLHQKAKNSQIQKEALEENELLQKSVKAEQTEAEIKLLISSKQIQGLEIQQLKLESEKRAAESATAEKALALLKKEAQLKESQLKNQELENLRANQALMLATKRLEEEKRKRQIDDLQQKQLIQSYLLKEKEVEKKEQEKKIDLLDKENKIKEIQKKSAEFRITVFIIVTVLSLLALMYVLLILKRVKAQRKIIEQQSKELIEKNAALMASEEEAKQISEELLINNENLELSKNKIEQQNVKIMASINYAKKIQDSTLPDARVFDGYFDKYFIFFQPCDLVSGDFYWAYRYDDVFVVVVADCTGHGVPGAFLSFIGGTLLNQIIIDNNEREPAQILNKLNKGFFKTLSKDYKNPEKPRISDGMDLCVCVIEKADKKNYKIKYAGAKNELLYIVEDKMEYLVPNKVSLGTNIDQIYTQQEVTLPSKAQIYLYSDGFKDQIGEKSQMRLTQKKFRELIYKNKNLEFDQQPAELSNFFQNWKGSTKQLDDILVVGLKMD